MSYIKLAVAMYINDDTDTDETQLMLKNESNYEDQSSYSETGKDKPKTVKNIPIDYLVPKMRENFIELTKFVKVYFEPNAKKTSF